MSSLLLILLSSVLVNIVVLAGEPRWRPFAGIPGIFEGARAIAIASAIVVPLTAVSSWLFADLVLRPMDLGYLRTLVFAAIALTIVPIVEMAMRRDGRLLPQRPAFALLMTTHATVFGVALLADERQRNLLDALLFAVVAAAGLGFLLLAFAALQERLRHADLPAVFREAPLALVTAGIMALGFMGFTGLVQE